jgi:type IV pilus assembly protein PilB
MKLRIGELLTKYGIISQDELKKALEIQKKEKNKKLGEILINLGYIKSMDLIWILSEQADVPFVEVRPEMLDQNLINRYPEKILLANCILPLYETDDKIFVALGDPMSEKAMQEIKKYSKKAIVASGADPHKIIQVLNRFFLSEQLEKSVKPAELLKNEMRIRAADATIETIDESGKKMIRKTSIEITIKKPEDTGDDN